MARKEEIEAKGVLDHYQKDVNLHTRFGYIHFENNQRFLLHTQ
jgi:hypothetical protein